MALDDWKPVVDIFAGLSADEQDILFAKLNEERQLHVIDEKLIQSLFAGSDGGGRLLVGSRRNVQEARFFEHDPNNLLDIVKTGSASAIPGGGQSTFSTGTTVGSTLDAVMRESNRYSSDHTSFWSATIDFTTPSGSGYTEIGPWSKNKDNGWTLHRSSSGIYLRRYKGSTTPVEDIPTPQWNGAPNGDGIYTDINGDPATIDPTKRHLVVWATKWLSIGSTGVYFVPEDLSRPPFRVHTFKYANRIADVSVETPNLPIHLFMTNGDTAEDLISASGCWAFGTDDPNNLPFVSESNSSTTPLLEDQPSPRAYISAIHHPSVSAFLKSDVSGILRIYQSRDASADDHITEINYDPADGSVFHGIQRRLEFVSVDFTPDTDQTEFTLQTTLSASEVLGQDAPIDSMISDMPRNSSGYRVKAGLFTLDENTGPPGTPPKFIPHRGTEEFGIRTEVKKSALPAGASTSAKQLPDNHNVTVSNQITQPTTPSDVQPVKDDYALGEVLPDQNGAGTVLDFTFSQPVVSFWVAAMGTTGRAKVDHYGGVPSETAGIPVVAGSLLPIPEPATGVKVFAPVGLTITVWGQRR